MNRIERWAGQRYRWTLTLEFEPWMPISIGLAAIVAVALWCAS